MIIIIMKIIKEDGFATCISSTLNSYKTTSTVRRSMGYPCSLGKTVKTVNRVAILTVVGVN